jgi:hypothetical protein
MHQVGKIAVQALPDFENLPDGSCHAPPAIRGDPAFLALRLPRRFHFDFSPHNVENILKIPEIADRLPELEVGLGFVHRLPQFGPPQLALCLAIPSDVTRSGPRTSPSSTAIKLRHESLVHLVITEQMNRDIGALAWAFLHQPTKRATLAIIPPSLLRLSLSLCGADAPTSVFLLALLRHWLDKTLLPKGVSGTRGFSSWETRQVRDFPIGSLDAVLHQPKDCFAAALLLLHRLLPVTTRQLVDRRVVDRLALGACGQLLPRAAVTDAERQLPIDAIELDP